MMCYIFRYDSEMQIQNRGVFRGRCSKSLRLNKNG